MLAFFDIQDSMEAYGQQYFDLYSMVNIYNTYVAIL